MYYFKMFIEQRIKEDDCAELLLELSGESVRVNTILKMIAKILDPGKVLYLFIDFGAVKW